MYWSEYIVTVEFEVFAHLSPTTHTHHTNQHTSHQPTHITPTNTHHINQHTSHQHTSHHTNQHTSHQPTHITPTNTHHTNPIAHHTNQPTSHQPTHITPTITHHTNQHTSHQPTHITPTNTHHTKESTNTSKHRPQASNRYRYIEHTWLPYKSIPQDRQHQQPIGNHA